MRGRGQGSLLGERNGTIVCFTHTADAGADEPEEGGEVLCVGGEVCEVECQEGEVVRGVDARVNVPQKPFVAI